MSDNYSFKEYGNGRFVIQKTGDKKREEIFCNELTRSHISSITIQGSLSSGQALLIFVVPAIFCVGLFSLLSESSRETALIRYMYHFTMYFGQVTVVMSALIFFFEFMFDWEIFTRMINRVLSKRHWTVTFIKDETSYEVKFKSEKNAIELDTFIKERIC